MGAMEPKPIHRLADEVVNRVAAGEVIHRPASALKEILENSLDAGATSIVVTVKDGGNKLLQVTDNGCGIREADLPILCERHTTSKLSKFEDLSAMSTFGFRGEALASISFVANLTVTTMTRGATHALKASYCDGALDGAGARPCAGNPGTTITVENLFYNVPARRRALRSPSEEFARVLEVIQRYAALRVDVAFACRKLGDARPALHCPVTPNRIDRIRAIYGANVARELARVNLRVGGGVGGGEEEGGGAPPRGASLDPDAPARCDAEMLVSTAGYHSKRTTFVLFINDRLVECAPLKRAVEATYAAVLPKSERPFAFASLRLPPETVDVNVHPTKREVHFLRQDEIVEAIREAIEAKLLESNDTRTFAVGRVGGEAVADAATDPNPDSNEAARRARPTTTTTQTLLPGARRPGEEDEEGGEGDARAAKKAKTTARDKVGGDHKLVRTDARLAAGSLDAFFAPSAGTRTTGGGDDAERLDEARRGARERRRASHGEGPSSREEEEEEAAIAAAAASDDVPDGETTRLSSVRELWGEIMSHAHEGLTRVVRGLTLVGPADISAAVWLLQHGTKLYAVRARALARELFYQRVVARFGASRRRALAEPAPIADLVMMALEDEAADDEGAEEGAERGAEEASDAERRAVAAAVADLLAEKAPMLREYFAVDIDEETRTLTGLPVLVEGHTPPTSRLPEFVLSLAHEVEWEEEKGCFRTVADALARFYAASDEHWDEEGDYSGADYGADQGADQGAGGLGEDAVAAAAAETAARDAAAEEGEARVARHALFPAMSRWLRPSKTLAASGAVTQVACLEQLYRVFERC